MRTLFLQTTALFILFISLHVSALAQGQLWGMTENGGTSGQGVIFQTNPDGTGLNARYAFPSSFPGALPGRTKLTAAANGKFYGVTPLGGVNNAGVIYEFDPAANVYTKKFDFLPSAGTHPEFGLTLAGNNKLYGVTPEGGTSGGGVLFEYDPSTNSYTVKHHFSSAQQQGSMPNCKLLLASNGKLYGTTFYGGDSDSGTLFEYDMTTVTDPFGNTQQNNIFKVKISTFGSSFLRPWGDLIQASDGLIYGTQKYQYPTATYIYSYAAGSISFNYKTNFNGGYCEGLAEVSGKLFGTASADASNPNEAGFIFEYTIANNTYAKRYSFLSTNSSGGLNPTGVLSLAANGKLYGSTDSGGTFSQGTLFEFDPTTYTLVKKIDFSTTDGQSPTSIQLASNGKFYGTTKKGGLNNRGTLYEYNNITNVLTRRVDFSYAPNGSNPLGSLAMGSNRLIYGTTTEGGASGKGVLFKLDPATNTYTKLIDFNGTNGGLPQGGLLSASNGLLYGMTYEGGVNNQGVIFQYDVSSDTFTKIYDFSQSMGTYPRGTLIQGSNGKIYGVTSNGGSFNSGVIFELNPAGNSYTKKLDLGMSTTGAVVPYGSLLQAANGKFYVTTAANSQLMLEYNLSNGTSATLPGSCTSRGTLIQDANQKLYGVTSALGGDLFEYDLASSSCTSKATVSPVSSTNVVEADYSLTLSTNGKYYGMINGDVLYEYSVTGNTYASKSTFSGSNGLNPHGTLLLQLTPTVAASSVTFSPVYSTQLQINFTPGTGSKRLVVIKQGSAVDFVPSENTSYNVGDVIAGNRIVKTDGGSSVYVTGLLTSTTYYVKVFEYNELNAKKFYLVANAPGASVITLPPPDVPVVTPANNSVNQNVTLNVTAKTLTGATTYTLELNTAPDFTGTLFSASGTKTQSFSGLSYATVYYARAKTNLSPDYSIITSFSTAPPEYFSYVGNPANGAVNVNDNLTVTSNTTIGASTYTIELNTASDFTGTSLVKTGTASQVFNNLAVATTYYSRVKTNLSSNWGVTRSFTTGNAPTLSYITTPTNNSTNQLWSLNVISNAVTGASTYNVQLSPLSDFSGGVVQGTSSTTTIPVSGLSYNTLYYVRVNTNLSPGVWGPTKMFTTGYPSTFSYITSPASGAVNVARVVNLTSAIVKDATSYTIEANTVSDFTGTSIVNTSTSNVISFALDYSTTYYIRVKTNLVPEWGPTRSFTTSAAIASTYVLTPSNNAINQWPTLTVTANDVYNATSYTIQLSPVSDFSSGVIELTSTSKAIVFSQLSYNTTYYSRVTTDRSPGLWGATRNFKTIDQYMTAPANGTTNVNWVTNVTVNSISGATSYTIEANTQPDFTGTSIVKTGASATQSFTLAYDQTYYVRATSNKANGWGTAVRSFTTGNPVGFSYIVTPANGATGVATTVSVTSNTVTGASSYTIELNTASDFTGTSIVKTSASRTISFSGLASNTTYYNRVQTNLAPGQWGVSGNFSTINPGGRIAIDASDESKTDTEKQGFNIIVDRNPFQNQLSLTVESSESGKAEIKIIDMLGRTVIRESIQTNERKEFANNLSTGPYILKVNYLAKVINLRIVKE